MSAVLAQPRLESPWRRPLLALAALVVLIVLLYRDTALAMVGIWSRSDTFAHAFLVLPIFAWLVWRQRELLVRLTPKPRPAMLPLLVLAALAWLVSELVSVNAGTQFAFVAMLVLAVPTVLGFEVARTILFPLLFLFFAVPFGEFLMPTLMDSTADFTVFAVSASGIPVFREGRQFIIPSGSWSVVEACSGVRYLIASFMVGSLFAYLNYRSTRRRIAFMLVSLAVPVVANWLRAYMIVMLGHLSGNTIAVGADHLIYGWLFFGVVIGAMYLIGARWAEPDAPAPDPATRPPRAPGTIETPWLLPAALSALFVTSMPPLVVASLERLEGHSAAVQLALPDRLADGWRASDTGAVAWRPHVEGAAAQVMRFYAGPQGTVGVGIAFYRNQDPLHKLVSAENVLVRSADSEWNEVATGRRPAPLAAAGIPGAATAELLGTGRPGLARRAHLRVWRFYWIDGRFVAGDAAAKLAGALARARGRGDDGASIVFIVDDESSQHADAVLEAFASSNGATLDALLRAASAVR